MSARTKKSLSIADPLQRYLQEVHAYPYLRPEEELALAKSYRERNDVEAARKLVMSHLRLVAKIAMEYRSSYYNVLDLIQEGNVGLLHAVQEFDPEKGARLGTYAQWWIRSYILKFILDNFRLIKLGTTKVQKKLFYNLMREKERIEASGCAATPEALARELGVEKEDVMEMEQRLRPSEYALEAPVRGRGDSGGKEAILADFLPIEEQPVDEVIAKKESQDILKQKFEEFSQVLNEREKKIFQERLLAELPLTLQEIADDYGITKERVRQIEERLLKRLKEFFTASGIKAEDMTIVL